jgi:hypothetical protein
MAIVSFRSGEAISAGNLVTLNGSGTIFKASALISNQASVVGVAIDSGASDALIRVDPDSYYSNFSGLTPGYLQYLSVTTSGAVVDYPTWATQLDSLPVSGAYLTQIGRAISSSGISIELNKPIYITK